MPYKIINIESGKVLKIFDSYSDLCHELEEMENCEMDMSEFKTVEFEYKKDKNGN